MKKRKFNRVKEVEIEERNGNIYVKNLPDVKGDPNTGLFIIDGQILTYEEFKQRKKVNVKFDKTNSV